MIEDTAYLAFLTIASGMYALASRKARKKNAFMELASGAKNTSGPSQKSGASLLLSVHAVVFIICAAAEFTFFASATLAALAPALVFLYSKYQEQKGRLKAKQQIESVLSGLGCALYGDPSLSKAVADVASRTDDPMRSHLLLVAAEIAHGQNVDDALRSAARRVDDEIFTFAIDAISICRATGADVCVVLDRLARLAGNRVRFSDKVRALASQQKATAKIVTVIPVCFLLAAYSFNPIYAAYLKTNVGLLVLAYATTSVAAGFYMLNRMTTMATVGGRS